MARHRRYVRQMPKIYGNLQKPQRSFEPFFRSLRRLLWVLVLGAVAYVGLFSEWFTVQKVEVQGTRFTSAEEVEALVPVGSNIWFVSEEAIRSKVMEDERVEAVALFRGLPDSLRVVVQEREPALLWYSGDTLSVVDKEGLAFVQYKIDNLPAMETELGRYLSTLPRIQDTKALPVSVNSEVVSTAFTNFITTAQKELTHHLPEATIDRIEIADTTYDVTFVAKEGLRVQFNSLGDAGVQVRNLTRLIRQQKASLTSQVDLRIDRWAYVH